MSAKRKSLFSYIILFFKNRLRTRRSQIFFVIFLLIALFVVRGVTKAKFEVETHEVSKETFVESISASGEMAADQAIDLNFETGGTVSQVYVKFGQQVKKGDLIAKLDTTNLYSTYLSADATLRASLAALDSTYDSLANKESTETFAEISTRTASETTKDKAYQAYIVAQRNLSGATLRAPFDGIIASFPDGLAEGVNIFSPVGFQISVVNPDTIYFLSDVNEVDIPKLISNQKVVIHLDAYSDEEYAGVVEGVAFDSVTTSTGGSAYPVRVSFPSQDALKYKLGMNGDAEFIISEKKDQVLVPQTSIVDEDSKSYVWKIEGGKAKRTEVNIGASSIDDVSVISGVSEGDTIIVRPPSDLKEGDRVKTKS